MDLFSWVALAAIIAAFIGVRALIVRLRRTSDRGEADPEIAAARREAERQFEDGRSRHELM